MIERIADEARCGGNTELLLEVLAMGFRRGGGDPERFGDLLVTSAGNDQPENVAFARCQGSLPSSARSPISASKTPDEKYVPPPATVSIAETISSVETSFRM